MSGFSQLSSFYKLYGLKVGATPCDSLALVFGCLAVPPAVPLCFRQAVISFDCISATANGQSHYCEHGSLSLSATHYGVWETVNLFPLQAR